MNFYSILFKNAQKASDVVLMLDAPDYFIDLNLDQIIDAITAGRQEYDLKPFFYTCLSNIDEIIYRQEIMRDMESQSLRNTIKMFAVSMNEMRDYMSQVGSIYYDLQKQRLLLDAVELYCKTITSLNSHLSNADLKSDGLLKFRKHLLEYSQSNDFLALIKETSDILQSLSMITYTIYTLDNSVTVGLDTDDIDYSKLIEKTFEKFKKTIVEDYKVKYTSKFRMNDVEAKILQRVAKLYPEIFKKLDNYYNKNAYFLDQTIATFDREIQFYIAFLEYIERFKREGFKFCYPIVTQSKKELYNFEGFDLALANKLVYEKFHLVTNDFFLSDNERIFVITGPNQGGKTTFARVFGQLHHLAKIGCNVPGREAKLLYFDSLFTLFEKEENIETLHGKLEDDLYRVKDILERATPDSIIIFNEVFTSTTLQDAVFLSKQIMKKIVELDCINLWVTFIDELSTFSQKNVSMVSNIDPHNMTLRTFKITRKPADGFAYALSIAKKYKITYDCLIERIKP